jgi:AraC-like DNA-binding protein
VGTAAFSPFHFDRVFKAVTGETLFGFIQRVRLERAAAALLAHQGASVLEVALDHGLASAATFARAFRARFGIERHHPAHRRRGALAAASGAQAAQTPSQRRQSTRPRAQAS